MARTLPFNHRIVPLFIEKADFQLKNRIYALVFGQNSKFLATTLVISRWMMRVTRTIKDMIPGYTEFTLMTFSLIDFFRFSSRAEVIIIQD